MQSHRIFRFGADPLFRPFFRHLLTLSLGLTFSLGAGTFASARDYTAGNIAITHPFARATVPGQPSGGAYISIENKGKETDTLKSVSTPIAKSAEIHTMQMDGDVMKMREVGSVELKPTAKIDMQPGGGYQLMLLGLNKPLKSGDQFPMTLTFEKAGKIEISVTVEPFGATAEKPMDHMH